MTDQAAAKNSGTRVSLADRILVAVAVVCFWTTVLALPLMLGWVWQMLGEGHYGSQKDPKLLLAVTLVPLSPCFATVIVGGWHIRRFMRLRRPLRELDILPIVSVFCIATLTTALALEF